MSSWKKKRLASPHGREKTPGNKRAKGNSHRRAGSIFSCPSFAAGVAAGAGSDDSRVSGDGDRTIAMDEAQGSPKADPAMAAGEAWDESMPFHREEFVRVISSCLRGLGYEKASKMLEEESGSRADLDESTPSLLSCVSAGRWEQALSLLGSISFSSKSLHVQARALLLRQRFLELVEDRCLEDALTCLREEIAPLFSRRETGDREGNVAGTRSTDDDVLGPEQLHVLSALLLAPTAVSLRRLSSPGKAWVSRLAARSDTRVALQGLLARGGRAVAPGRLEHLVSQALRLQIQECDYHNILPQKMPLTEDHSCGLRALPQVTTHVLEHGDEVWCCQFSNGGGMLATSSADGVLLLWNLDGSRERDGRRSPEMHKRITVSEGPPHCIAWSPDDSSILTNGASPAVTRWDVASGEEIRTYRGVHEEGVTGVAWLRDGRGFVTSSLDRKVVIWNLGGTVLSVWKCHSRITGIVVTSTPLEAMPLSYPPFDDHSKHYQHGGGFRGTALSADCSSGTDAALSSRHRVLANRVISNGRGGDVTPSSPTPSASRSRSVVNPLQAGTRAGIGAVSGRRSPMANSSSNLRRCRVWAIIKGDTIKALDVEVMEYGESSEPRQGGDDGGSSRINGSTNDGVGAGAEGGESDRARDGRNSGVRQEDGRSSDARHRRNGVGIGGGGGGSGSVCARSSPSRRKAGLCEIEEGPEECKCSAWNLHSSFDERIITGVCAAKDGSDLLLLHMNTGRILSWNTITRKVFKRYRGHRQSRYIVRSTFGGLNDGFVASGSEDSLVYLWHRRSGELFAALPGHAGTVNSVHWNPTRPGMLVSVSDDHTVRLWASALPEPPLSILPHPAGESVRDDGIPASPNGISSDVAGEGSGQRVDTSGAGKDAGRVVIGPLSPPRGGGGDRGVGGYGAQLKREAGTEAFSDGCRGSGVSGRGPLSGKGQGWVQQGSRGSGSAGVDGEPAETRGRRSSPYRRGQSQGLDAWERGEGHRDRYNEVGFSAKIAALRW